MTDVGQKVGEIIAAIVTLAALAVVVSNSANTSNVLTAGLGGITNLVKVALSPITGGGTTL